MKMAQFMSAAASAIEGSRGRGGSWNSEFGEAWYKDFSKLCSVGILRKNVGKRYFGCMEFVDQPTGGKDLSQAQMCENYPVSVADCTQIIVAVAEECAEVFSRWDLPVQGGGECVEKAKS
jgi:hypothetical protein